MKIAQRKQQLSQGLVVPSGSAKVDQRHRRRPLLPLRFDWQPPGPFHSRIGVAILLAALSSCLALFSSYSSSFTNEFTVNHGIVPNNMGTGSKETCVMTISAWNNFGFVWNLYDSITENSPSIGCFVWFVGDISSHPDKEAMKKIRRIMTIADRFTVVTMADMEMELGHGFKPLELAFKFDMVELQTTLKPFAFQYVFQKLGASSAIFLDNDIWVTGSLLPLQRELQKRSAIVTPHILSPIPEDGYKQKDLDILKSGVFNFGFVAFRNSPTANAFLEFWSDRLAFYGFVDLEKGMFYDQNWGMFIPAFFDHEDYMVIRDPRYNIAYWNLHTRGSKLSLDSSTGLPRLGDEPTVFVHFSGMSLLEEFDMYGISRHQNRYTLHDFPRMEAVMKEYIKKLELHDALAFRAIPYGYSHFLDGTTIDPPMRRAYAAAIYPTDVANGLTDSGDATPFYGVSISTYDRSAYQKNVASNPFCTSKICKANNTLSFMEWYMLYIPGSAVDLEGLFFYSGIEHGVWQKRKDLQAAFPNPTGENFLAFKDWFLKNSVDELMVSKEVFQSWRSVWKFHCNHHSEFHKIASQSSDIGVNIIGWHGGQFSIGITSNKLIAAAREVKISANAIQLQSCGSGKKFSHPSLLGYELTRSPTENVNIFVVNADSTYYVLKDTPSIVRANKYNIGYWAWELEIFPQLWMKELNEYDEIWCPSAFVKKSIETSPGYDGTPINVLPLPLLDAEAHHSSAPATSLPYEITSIEKDSKPFTFLVAFDFQSFMERKNPLAAIRAFLEAFPSSSDPTGNSRLVVKAHSGTPADMEEMREVAGNDSRVIFISRILSNEENIALHHYQDCYVSLHRSEGYGLNILESMGAGIPIIATNYSGNVEFFDSAPSYLEKCHFPVPFNLVKLKDAIGPYEAGNHWANPDHDYVVSAMKKVSNNNCKTKHGTEISKMVYTKFGEAAIGEKMQGLLNDATPRILQKQKEKNHLNLKFLERTLKHMKGWNDQ
ncbi:glycosyl transferase family protein [Nitzschia inconspicua]|uniref:Glycosyl transferase family protein n=1 Tax=Nitzschia inconspicua TaxID=303405 RepID=A0A9K3LB88_9STRA|nr:glycosyl transferase family protein [Nitzschia inconspicua]